MSNKICKTLCLNKKPTEYNKLFFGDYGNFQRMDKEPFPIFRKLAESSESNTWFMNEIDYSKDKKGWNKLPENARRMFHLNILYQNNLDSLVPNTFSILSNIASETWLAYLFNRISTEENIHALTYSSGLTQVFGAEASKMLDYIYDDETLKKRTYYEIQDAELFIRKIVKEERTDDEAKKAILLLLLRTYFLEGVKFPFSFFTTWVINKNYNNSLQGFSQALKLIAWDELTVHVVTGQHVMNILMSDENQGFLHLKDWFINKTIDMAKQTAELEMEWADYLLQEGNIPGFNKEIAYHFIRYWTDYRLNKLKINNIYGEKKTDIIDWFNEYRNLNKTQVALQEADTTNYQKGKLKNDLDKFDEILEAGC